LSVVHPFHSHVRAVPAGDLPFEGYRIMARHLTGLIGNVKLVELKVRGVDSALGQLAKRLSTRSVWLA